MDWFWTVIKFSIIFGVGFLKAMPYLVAILIGASFHFDMGHYISRQLKLKPSKTMVENTKEKLRDLKFSPGKTGLKHEILVSRNVDDAIEEIISLLLKDYVSSWYDVVVKHPSLFCKQLKYPIRQMLFTFKDRCQKVDDVKLFTSDIVNIVTDHLQHMKTAIINPAEKIIPYRVFPFLSDKKPELDYLRDLCEFLLLTLIPLEYRKNSLLRKLLREIFSGLVFYPIIDKLCDPDAINLKLISYLKQQQIQAEKHSRTYAYAETYEDFIKLIQESGVVEDLQRMRYYIMTEIMEATTISNVKRSKGMDAEKEFNPQKTNKGDLLQARNLSRYLNQLRFAKGLCEKRLKSLGGPDYVSSPRSSTDVFHEDKAYVPGRKVLSMAVIFQSSFCRRYFSKFLQKEDKHSLLGFWEAVEDMKCADKELWHKLGNDIVQMYVHNQASSVQLSKNTLKGIKEFMMANKGPEAFFQAQEEVYKMLEENFYASFIVSHIYHKMLTDSERQGIDFTQEALGEDDDDDDVSDFGSPSGSEVEKSIETSVFDHSSYARSQLKILVEKVSYKNQALQALRNNPKCDKKVIMMMEKEIDELVKEQSLLENHIEKTEMWIEFLGVWQATIIEAMERKEDDKLIPYFIIRVHLASDAEFSSSKMGGWVVSKSLNSFHSLHQKLVPAAYWLKKIDLPTKPRFKSLDKNYLLKAKSSLQTFLSAITKDDGLNKSEALYDFLSPSPEYMKHPPGPVKKPFKFNLLQFFKGVQKPFGQLDEPEEEDLLFLDDSDKEDKKDSIAEPLYILTGEIFELKGVFNWLRRTLILFVQITSGQTINRQLREMVSWIVSEPMLLFYLQLFHETMWPPGGHAPQPAAERSGKEKAETRLLAKHMFLSNTPVLLSKMIGQQNARKGMSKIFDALQNKTLNKHLTYKILEAFLYAYAPELKKITSLYSIDD